MDTQKKLDVLFRIASEMSNIRDFWFDKLMNSEQFSKDYFTFERKYYSICAMHSYVCARINTLRGFKIRSILF